MANRRKPTDVAVEVRPSIENSPNLGIFEQIAAENPDKDFIIINDAKGAIQRHERAGWRIYKAERLYESEFEELSGAGKSRDGYAHLPVGVAGDGKPTIAVLMWAPKGTIKKIHDMRHAENRQRKAAYGGKAAQAAAQKVGGGIETYTPQGFGADGLKSLPNTIEQAQS